MERPLKVRLHILSPVHIGCDDVYEPTGFVIDEEKRKLIAFDPLDFIKSLSPQDRQTFSAYCMQGNISSIVNIYKFMSRKRVNGREIDVASDLVSHYTQVRNLPTNNEGKIRQELNKFSIYRTAYNPYNNMPYIPGSSIKGALRTAYLSKLAKDNGISGRRDRAKDLEIELLGGSFDKDPFRMMKVSDFLHVGNAKAKIVYAVNKKKRQSKFEALGPFQILESIIDGTIFEGFINLNKPGQTAGIKKPIEIPELLKAVHNFYGSIVNEESKVTNEINSGRIVDNRISEKFKDKLGKTVFLLRVGRHSGAEAVTLEGNRHIKIMQDRGQPPKFLDHATTLWLASETRKPTTNIGLIPFGWTAMEIIQ